MHYKFGYDRLTPSIKHIWPHEVWTTTGGIKNWRSICRWISQNVQAWDLIAIERNCPHLEALLCRVRLAFAREEDAMMFRLTWC